MATPIPQQQPLHSKKNICHQTHILQWNKHENCLGCGPGYRAGNQELPISVPELSPGLHIIHNVWHCHATEAVIFSLAWAIFKELNPYGPK